MMINYSIWNVNSRVNNFYQLYCPSTGETGKSAVCYLKGNLYNPETGQIAARDEYGFLLPGECINAYQYTNVKGDTYVRPYTPEYGESVYSVKSDGSLNSSPISLDEVSAEVLPKTEHENIELKPELYTHLQRTAVLQAIVGMAHKSGTVRVGCNDHGKITGLKDSISKYGSTDKLEAAVRNELAQRTNRLLEMNFIFREAGDKVFLDIFVEKSKAPIIFDHKYCFTRSGNQTRMLVDQQIIDYILEFKN